jgi:hypothetical protein
VKLASNIPIFGLALSLLGGFPLPSAAQESRWGSPDEDTVKFIKAVEAKWASTACSPQPDLKDVFADDFQGTSANGPTLRQGGGYQHGQSRCRATANSAR